MVSVSADETLMLDLYSYSFIYIHSHRTVFEVQFAHHFHAVALS